jgi:hypothetical protein
MIVEWRFSIVCGTSQILDQFAIRLENGAIATGMLYAVSMISQCRGLSCRPPCYRPHPPSRTERRPVLGSRP